MRDGRGGWVIAAVGVLLAVAVTAGLFILAPRILPPQPSSSPTPTQTPPPGGGGVPEDDGGTDPGTPPQPGTKVVPFITSAVLSDDGASVTVYSFVPGIVESGGTCTGSIVGTAATATTTGTVEVASTVCPPITIQLPAGQSGAFSVTVEYASTTSTGTSEPLEVEP